MKKIVILLLSISFSSLYSFNDELFEALCDKNYEKMKEILNTRPLEIADPIPSNHPCFEVPQGFTGTLNDLGDSDYKYGPYICYKYNEITLFHAAILRKDLQALDLLLEAFPQYVDIRDGSAHNLLYYACYSKKVISVDIANVLIKYNANLNAHNDNLSPLSLAWERGNRDLIKVLVQNGAYIKNVSITLPCAIKHMCRDGNASEILPLLELLLEYTPPAEFSCVKKAIHNFFSPNNLDSLECFVEQSNDWNSDSYLGNSNPARLNAVNKIPAFIEQFKELYETRYQSWDAYRDYRVSQIKRLNKEENVFKSVTVFRELGIRK